MSDVSTFFKLPKKLYQMKVCMW